MGRQFQTPFAKMISMLGRDAVISYIFKKYDFNTPLISKHNFSHPHHSVLIFISHLYYIHTKKENRKEPVMETKQGQNKIEVDYCAEINFEF